MNRNNSLLSQESATEQRTRSTFAIAYLSLQTGNFVLINFLCKKCILCTSQTLQSMYHTSATVRGQANTFWCKLAYISTDTVYTYQPTSNILRKFVAVAASIFVLRQTTSEPRKLLSFLENGL